MVDLNNPDFWTERSDYRKVAHDFTVFYSECAWDLAAVPGGAKVLDIAAGTGALACLAAQAGADVLATDFSAGMIAAIEEKQLPNLAARVMDGHALDLPDASFDAAFSMFGIMLFADWRKGLSEMARVLRPGGIACVGTWKEKAGAAANLLLANVVEWRFPEIGQPNPVDGLIEFSDPDRFRAAFEHEGLGDFELHEVVSDFIVDRGMLNEPDRLFQFSPVWPVLGKDRQFCVMQELIDLAHRNEDTIIVSSPAWIGLGRRLA